MNRHLALTRYSKGPTANQFNIMCNVDLITPSLLRTHELYEYINLLLSNLTSEKGYYWLIGMLSSQACTSQFGWQ